MAQKPVVVLSLSHSACLTGLFIGTLTENIYRDIEVMDLNSKASRNTDLIVPPSSPCACSLPSQHSWLAQLKWCFKPTSTAPKKHSQAYQVDGYIGRRKQGQPLGLQWLFENALHTQHTPFHMEAKGNKASLRFYTGTKNPLLWSPAIIETR